MTSSTHLTPSEIKAKQIKTWFKSIKPGNIKVMQNLLDKGFNVNAKDDNNNTALILSTFHNQIDIMKMLIDKKCSVDVTCQSVYYNSSTGMSALETASSLEHLEAIELLIKAGARVNKEEDKNTNSPTGPLYQAILSGRDKAVMLLIEMGAEVDMKKIKKVLLENSMQTQEVEDMINRCQILLSKKQIENAINKTAPASAADSSNIQKYKI